MYAADEQKRPVHGEAHNVARLVEIVGAGGTDGERPIEGGEAGRLVA